VEAVGRNANQFRPGDAVYGDLSRCGWGGFAEYVSARESALAPKPATLTFEEAAAVPQAAVLALQGLRRGGPLQPGQRVLVNGAGGGVGTFAVQIAKSFGAIVTGVDSTTKLDTMRSIGADRVIDYTQEDFTEDRQRYDLILDAAAHRSMFDYQRALSRKGVYVMVGGATARLFQVLIFGPLITMTGDRKMGVLLHEPNQGDLALLDELLEAGTVVPIIDRRYPLSEVAEALRYFGEGHVRGKVVVTV
jgi:NADPH:quinone reductase-like Zn-dependent oxidoreductase